MKAALDLGRADPRPDRAPSQGAIVPGPASLERAALPGHLRAAAAALFDDLPGRVDAEVIDAAVSRLSEGAARLAARLPAGTEIIVDAFRARLAAGCPAAAVPDPVDAFRWTPATAARTIGLRAVAASLRGDRPPGGDRASAGGASAAGWPVELAVDAVVADLAGGGGERSPGPWLAGLSAPGRAVAVAQGRRWAEQALAWLPLRLVDNRSLRFLEDDWWSPGPRPVRSSGGRTLVVHGRRDITVGSGAGRVAVTVVGGPASGAGLADVDALTALAALACDPRGRLVRVVRAHPASGQVAAVDVTPELLNRGVEVVLATASVLALAIAGGEPEAVAGPGCTWCHRRDGCQPGTAWLSRPDRRSMGLPLPAHRV